MRRQVPSNKLLNRIIHGHIIRFCAFIIFTCLLIHPGLRAQTTENSREQIEDIIERAVSEFDPETSEMQITELVEFLIGLANNPVNINRDGLDELAGVPGLNLQLAQAIIRYRDSIKPFESTEELKEVDGIGEVTLENILPFITIGESSERRRDLFLNPRYWTHDSRFESLAGYQRVMTPREGYRRPDSLGGYLGSPVKYNHRLRYQSDHLSMNLTQDKDPGESLAGPADFDFTSWHVGIQDAGLIKNLVVGDFRVSFGQGLTLWNGGSFGKSSRVIGSAIKNDPGIRPYTSYQETNGFRGMAATVGQQLQVSGFYSNRRRSASETDDGRVRFPSASGLHRTLTERERRLNLRQETYGGRIRYQFSHGIVGASGYHNSFDRDIEKGTQPYQFFDFEGNQLSVLGTDLRLGIGPAIIFSEIARSSNGSFGGIAGSELSVLQGTDIAVAYRNYARDFQSVFGSGFGEQSSPQNETGFFTGLRQQFGSTFQINTYIDFFRTHGPRFRNNRPTTGSDWLARFSVEPMPNLSLYLQLRSKKWEQQMEDVDLFGRETIAMGSEMRSNARLHLEYNVLGNLRLRTRYDVVRYKETFADASFGQLIYQDVRFTPTSNLTLDARMTLFETDDFNSRVFQFENDLLYVMSNAMLFDQGQRSYIVVRYRPVPYLTFRLKAATTLYENRRVIGSGLDTINGSRKTDLGFQVKLKL